MSLGNLCYLAIGLSGMALIGVGMLFQALGNWQKRIRYLERMRSGDWEMISTHQDILANHESRLLRAGMQGNGTPVLTMRQMLEAHMRAQGVGVDQEGRGNIV